MSSASAPLNQHSLHNGHGGLFSRPSMDGGGPGGHGRKDSISGELMKDNDNLLRNMFFTILRHHQPKMATKLDVVYALSSAWTLSESDGDFEMLEQRLKDLNPDELIMISSAFSQLLNLHNLSEEISQAQHERAVRMGEVEQSTRSTNRSFKKLIASHGVTPSQIYKTICNQTVDLVFTAHPTQAMRQTLLKKYAKIRSEMERLHNSRMSPYETMECHEAIRSEIAACWRTDEIRRTKPTPQGEMRQGLGYFHETIFPALPSFYRRIDTALKQIGQPMLPLDHDLFNFGSWMGGDRDGNPFVTPEATREVVLTARMAAVNEYERAIEKLMYELSVWRCNDELKAAAEKIHDKQAANKTLLLEDRKRKGYIEFHSVIPLTEPYRLMLSEIRDRLWHTREVLQSCMIHTSYPVKATLEADELAYSDKADLLGSLLMMYKSLVDTRDSLVANGRLLDTIRQVQCFGLAMVRLDIRQESTRHSDAVSAITNYLGMGNYSEWDEEKRLEFLLRELQGKRPLLPPGLEMTEEVAAVINAFKVIADLPIDSLGAYIISMAQSSSDVLAVLLLQRECGVEKLLRVAPLFETLDDLANSEAAMRRLLENEWYRELIDGKQECMIGYSDSGKDAGRLAAAWGLYEVQERLAKVAEENNVKLTLFHGRGGTVGRGGGPTHLAVLSQPPGTINGALRVTIQGETMEQQFGEKEVCFRTLDLYTSAVLEASLNPTKHPKKEYREVMATMSKVSCDAYRAVVQKDERFIDYFGEATPVSELGRMNIGSRPAKRRGKPSLSSLRAIPWIFAWTQTRFALPVWLGMGEAFKAMEDEGKLPLLQEMYTEWPFFSVTMDMVEMVFAKSDPSVHSFYERGLVDKSLWHFGAELREKFENTKQGLLKVVRHSGLLQSANTAMLQQKLALRTPYVTPLNLLQVFCLKAVRAMERGDESVAHMYDTYMPEEAEVKALLLRDPHAARQPYKAAIEDTMILTMKGISAGMQNTG